MAVSYFLQTPTLADKNSLHGHAFQTIERSATGVTYDPAKVVVPDIPMRRDTIMVLTGGYVVLRFRADNPDMSPCHFKRFTLTYQNASFYFTVISSGMSKLVFSLP
jgi:hypothetical protein